MEELKAWCQALWPFYGLVFVWFLGVAFTSGTPTPWPVWILGALMGLVAVVGVTTAVKDLREEP